MFGLGRAWARRVVACAIAGCASGGVLAAGSSGSSVPSKSPARIASSVKTVSVAPSLASRTPRVVHAQTAAEARARAPGPSPQALAAVRFALEGDARGRPFAVVDKRRAQLLIYRADGRLAGITSALLGMTPGDRGYPGFTTPGGTIPIHERTTPAGRFESMPGRNHRGEAIVWFDYDSSLAIHRLRPAPAAERRPARLSSATPDDNRISLGCVVIDGDFYDLVVAPTLGRYKGLVYILPESPSAGLPWAGAAVASAL